ncbi:MAG TPA: YwiC-like family protein [Pyrinomonadaceae bacterium]|nr:YwiC-like family protein [Pyrinomonadaceae bacterium]
MSETFFYERHTRHKETGEDGTQPTRTHAPTTQRTRTDAPMQPARVRLRTVALPTEHGGWGLALEPVVLGLLVAPTVAGLFLAVATLGAFLARHPLKIIAGDRRRGRRFPRTAAAERFALLYGGIALAGFAGATVTAVNYQFIIPLLLAAPFAFVQLSYDATGRSRSLAPELSGSFGLAAVSTSIALAAGWPHAASYGLWIILAARVIPAILYVRARLKQLHGEPAASAPLIAAHTCALVILLLLVWLKVAPLLAAVALFVLLLRAVHGISSSATDTTAKQVGIREIGYGALTVLAVAAGHLLSL